MNRPRKVCVIGAGVIGLSTAVRLLEVEPGLRVTVIADKFTPHTTSDVAAGINRYWNIDSLSPLMKWAYTTHKYTSKLYHTEGPLAGIQRSVLIDVDENEKNYSSDVDHRKLSVKELKKLYPQKDYKYGSSFITFLTECKIYLPWLMQRIKSRGGTILEKHVNSFGEIADDYDVIVNCSGLGARKLANDETTKPIRGQVFKVKAPWIKIGTFDNIDWIHILPCSEDVVVGGVTQHGNWDLSVNRQDADHIWEKACKIESSLKYAPVKRESVALRPGRPGVRLEREDMVINGKKFNVVHNYGHGGRGIGLHWGCALDASALVLQCLRENILLSKL